MNGIHDIGIQNSLAENLDGLIKNGRLPHAIMLRGGSEALRQRLSLFLAEAFVCEDDSKPCGKCSHCLKAQSGNHPLSVKSRTMLILSRMKQGARYISFVRRIK